MNNPDAPFFLVWQPALLDAPGRCTLHVVTTTVDAWGKGRDQDRYELLPPEESVLDRYLARLAEAKPSWSVAQTGALVVAEDVSLDTLRRLRLDMRSGFLGMNRSVAGLYSYDAVEKALELVEDPHRYRLFAENRERFDDAMERFRVRDELRMGYVGNRFRALAEFAREPEVKRPLVEWMRHDRFGYRGTRTSSSSSLLIIDGRPGFREGHPPATASLEPLQAQHGVRGPSHECAPGDWQRHGETTPPIPHSTTALHVPQRGHGPSRSLPCDQRALSDRRCSRN